jgi:hypothetical protein
MSTAGLDVGTPAPLSASGLVQSRSRDHRFFTAMAAALALAVFIGFAPTYYLRGAFGGRALSNLVHLHGALATSWMLLFLVQTSLVSVRRTDLHRRLGVAGGVLAVLLVLVGYVTAIEGARHGVTPPGGPPAMAFLAVPLGTMATFAVLIAAGLFNRKRPETHKRLMLLGTIALITPALARFRFIGGGGPPVAITGTLLFVVACLIYDRASHGRVHPAFLWGGLFILVSLPVRFGITQLDAWLPVARWLTQ